MNYNHWYYNSKSEQEDAESRELSRDNHRKMLQNKKENWKRFHSYLETNPYN